MSVSEQVMEEDKVRQKVREGYGRIAQSSGCSGTSCCGSNSLVGDQLAVAIGYAPEELSQLPEGANMGLSCGNPSAIAALKTGEVLVDLGSGGGFDLFLAGPKLGATGRAIGVDMTPEMISKARANLRAYRKRTGLDNIEFRLGEIEHLPVADKSVDVVISNCVINLSPDKQQVWREMARVLRPGGRVAVSDLALLQPLPPPILKMVEALVGCIAGAALVEDIQVMLEQAGFEDIQLTPHPEYVAAMTQWNDPLCREILGHLPSGTSASDFITSLSIEARLPECGV